MPELEVRVAGAMPAVVQNHPVCKDLNFLGQLGVVQMENEFLSADVLVLPALSEGFAGVVAEAIGAGCPVIVTKEAGSPIVHGREGLIVPSRDAGALAEAMQRIVTDRPLREHCAAECLKQIPYYDEAKWRERLVDVLQEEIDG
jgi:glycosyltransferase involved in cell wall biosynthesis